MGKGTEEAVLNTKRCTAYFPAGCGCSRRARKKLEDAHGAIWDGNLWVCRVKEFGPLIVY